MRLGSALSLPLLRGLLAKLEECVCVLCSDLNTPVEGHVSKSVMWEVGMLASSEILDLERPILGCQRAQAAKGQS